MSAGRRGWLAFGLGASAVTWASLLVVAAFVAPAYRGETCGPGGDCTSSSSTLFTENGWWVIEMLAAVFLVAGLAFWALHRFCATHSSTARRVAMGCIIVLSGVAVVSSASVGLFIFPVVMLLFASAALVPTA